MLLFFLYDLVHVPGVRGVPQLDEPYFPGSAIYLGGDVSVSILSSFLESPVNLIICDLHSHAVWAELLFVSRGEIALLHCIWGDQPLGEAFRISPKFFHYHSRSHVCRAVEVPQATILDFFHDESHSFVLQAREHYVKPGSIC
jgi:hypothetical protein